MNKIGLILVNIKHNPTKEFVNCDIFSDINYDSNLNFFDKLNLIGVAVRKYELVRDSKYDKLIVVDCNYYSIDNIEENWFADTFNNLELSQKEMYTDNVLHMIYPPECRISFKLLCMDSIPFNFISNFGRFYNRMNKHIKSDSEENLLYAYTYMCKIKVYNLDSTIVNKFKKNLI